MSFLRSLFPILGFALLPLFTAMLAVSEEPYETFRVGLEGTDLLQGSRLDPFWDFTPGFNLSLETPFYLGVGQAGLHQFNAQGIDTPDLESRYTYLGWGYLLKPWERLEFVPAIRGGIWWQDY
ncbi:MAG: hypothetical protein HKN21_13445, partial [Candidatus Eisenbacteria bacterium]|nr:hypothetical protein [Candidatus Eisenbacteria bacterium]